MVLFCKILPKNALTKGQQTEKWRNFLYLAGTPARVVEW
jgi:hypothetical protein